MAAIALLLMAVAFVGVALPLLRPAAGRSVFRRDADDTSAAERDAAYTAIKDLEFEHHLGNLSDEDYERLRREYVERAARALRDIDASAGRGDGTW